MTGMRAIATVDFRWHVSSQVAILTRMAWLALTLAVKGSPLD